MKIHYDLDHFDAKKPVVTIGTFDGVHLGHQKVLSKLRDIGQKHKGETVIFTFYPHPRLITSPGETNLRLLTTLKEKTGLFREAGMDHLVVYPFTKAFSELSYSEFVSGILIEKMKTYCLVVGYDHKFGKNREGGFEYLKECARKHNFNIERLDALSLDDVHISSSKIRAALEEGNIEKANLYLGYEYTLHGTVVEGKRVGRRIGFPTANIEASDMHKLIPGYGVYAVKVKFNGDVLKGMLNIGTRPTFNNNADNRSIEVHIFDFDENIYRKEITLIFVGKIREEQRFDGADALVEQLKKDKINALRILAEDRN